MLPRDFPPRSTVSRYFRAWIAAGVRAHLHDVLYRRTRDLEGREESPTAAIIDSQSDKTGADAREMVGFDAPLVLWMWWLLCEIGATAWHVIYDGQWRGSDRSPLGHNGPLPSMVATVFFF